MTFKWIVGIAAAGNARICGANTGQFALPVRQKKSAAP